MTTVMSLTHIARSRLSLFLIGKRLNISFIMSPTLNKNNCLGKSSNSRFYQTLTDKHRLEDRIAICKRRLLTLDSSFIPFLTNFSHSCKLQAENTEDGQKLAQVSPNLGIMYTCKICSTRNAHTFSRKSYTEGVVIVQCENCKNNHLIADNLGWFEDIKQRNIEDILKEKGENVTRITDLDIPQDLRLKIASSLSETLDSNRQQGMLCQSQQDENLETNDSSNESGKR